MTSLVLILSLIAVVLTVCALALFYPRRREVRHRPYPCLVCGNLHLHAGMSVEEREAHGFLRVVR